MALQGENGVLIQCKSSTIDKQECGWEAVKEVVAGSAAYANRHTGVRFSLVAVTNRRFNGTARRQAQLNHVTLLDENDISQYLEIHPVTRAELTDFLFSFAHCQSSS